LNRLGERRKVEAAYCARIFDNSAGRFLVTTNNDLGKMKSRTVRGYSEE
jgi:hypothetical protein